VLRPEGASPAPAPERERPHGEPAYSMA
jgi:hypothetical protein